MNVLGYYLFLISLDVVVANRRAVGVEPAGALVGADDNNLWAFSGARVGDGVDKKVE